MPTDNINQDITREEKIEGGLVNDPADPGGRTFMGISEKSNPDLWTNGPPSEPQVRARYLSRYVQGPGFDKVSDPTLQAQLIDFGVNSGPAIAIQKLQVILGVAVDGVLGPGSLQSLSRGNPRDINNRLVVARCKMIATLVQKNPSQLKFLGGWLDRALQFLN
jgi:lysozyme family protein